MSLRATSRAPLGQTAGVSRALSRTTVRTRRVAIAAAILALAGSGLVAGAPVAGADTPITGTGAMARLAGTVAPVPPGATVLGPTAPATRLTADVALRPRDPGGLDAFVTAVSTPGSPRFHRYLPPGMLASTFGPTPATLAATRAWLTSTGLHLGATSPDGLLVPVSGTASQMEKAFAVPLVQARLASGREARIASRDPQVPAALSGQLAGVIGLSDQSVATPAIVRPTNPAPTTGAPLAAPVGSQVGPQACPAVQQFSSAWSATQLASTYGLSTLYGNGREGAGQTVGIFELEPYTPSDIQAFQSCYRTSVPVSDIPVDGGANGIQQGEAALDIEVVVGLAPGASVDVYSGPNSGSGPIDTYSRMVGDDTAKVLSVSWGQCEASMDPVDRSTEQSLFAMAASQGQSVVAASGDSGASDCYSASPPNGRTQLAVDDPSDQPDVTGVGGTTLTQASANAPSETTWNSGRNAGGGGNSSDFVAPAWQQVARARSADTVFTCGTAANQQCREVPDVSASADPDRGDVIYFGGGWGLIGGTSASSPLWAAVVADTNQGCAATAGLLGPAMYSAGAAAAFNDVTSGSNSLFTGSQYTARPGYDLATGWGSPRAPALLTLLTGSSAGCPTVTGLNPTSGAAVGGTTVTISGSGFGTATPAVTIGGLAAAVTASTPTSITAVTPDVGVGAVDQVRVTTTGPAAGTSPAVAASQFTYVSPQVTSVVANRGPATGGNRVTITGSGFTSVHTVTFGAAAATNVDVVSSATITVTVPPGPANGQPVHVVVTAATGANPAGAGSNYYYALPGYLMAASDGGIFNFGRSGFFGSAGGLTLSTPVVGVAMAPGDHGYWLTAAGGQVFPYGTAGYFGSAGQLPLTHPVVGIAATPDGRGYWLVASDGGIFSYGDAGFYGSTGAITLNRPVVGMAATPDGRGYWLVASDGGIFSYGDAGFYGSTGAITLNRPVVGMAADLTGDGYWLVASDGGIFAFGSAPFDGSTGGIRLNEPIVGMAST